MKTKIKKLLAIISAVAMLAGMMPVSVAAESSDETIAVHIIAASTWQEYRETHLLWGFGEALPYVTDDRLAYFNWAVGGHSTRSFYNIYWPHVKETIKAGDYVLMHFGHNDQHYSSQEDKDEKYTPLEGETPPFEGYTGKTYEEHFQDFIDEIKAKGAYPIMVTCVERLAAWNKETQSLTASTVADRAEAQIKLAEENDIPLIDLHKISRDYLAACKTYEEAWDIYGVSVGLDPSEGATHFNEKGAKLLARKMFEELQSQGHPLGQYLLPEGEHNPGEAGYLVNEKFDNKINRGFLAKPLKFDYEQYKYSSVKEFGTDWFETKIENTGDNNVLKFDIVKDTPRDTEQYRGQERTASIIMPFKTAAGAPTKITTGTYAAECKVKFPVYNSSKGENYAVISLRDDKLNQVSTARIANTASGISLTTEKGVAYKTIPGYDGSWINVKTLVNLDEGLYITYINDQIITKRAIIPGAALNDITISVDPRYKEISYNEVWFDDVKVYAVPADAVPTEEEALASGAIAADITYLLDEDFEWDTYDTIQTADGASIVSKNGSSIAEGCYDKELKQSGNYLIKTSIVDDADPSHGKAFKLETDSKNWYNVRKSIQFFRKDKLDETSNFQVVEFDFKYPESSLKDDVQLYVNMAERMHFAFKPKGFMMLAPEPRKFYNDELVMNERDFKYYSAEIDSDGVLDANKWYNIRFMLDLVNHQVDVFLNDVMIIQDADISSDEWKEGYTPGTNPYVVPKINATNAVRIGLFGAGSQDGTKSCLIDNIREYNLTDKQAVKMAKAGIEKYIGDGVYSTEQEVNSRFKSISERGQSYTAMELPYGGMTGYQYYASSTSKTVDGLLHTPHESYNWTISGESDFEIDRSYFRWDEIVVDKTKAPYSFDAKYGYALDSNQDIVYENGNPKTQWCIIINRGILNYTMNGKNPVQNNGTGYDIYYRDMDGRALIKYAYNRSPYSDANDGTKPDIKFTLNVEIKKGTASDELTKEIIIQRPVLAEMAEGIVVGKPKCSIYEQSTTKTNEAVFKSYIENKTEKDITLNLFAAFYDVNNKLLYCDVSNVEIAKDEEKLVACYSNPGRALDGQSSNGREVTNEAILALDDSINYVKFFLWSDGILLPLSPQTNDTKVFVTQ